MEVAEVFENGRSQAVRLPQKYRFTSDEVIIQRFGVSLVLTPKDKAWESFMNGIEGFTDDFMENGREGNVLPEEREEL